MYLVPTDTDMQVIVIGYDEDEEQQEDIRIHEDLPWWKQRRTKIMLGVMLGIVVALAVAMGL